MTIWLLEHLDTLMHRALDGYTTAERPGWETLQSLQWHVCNAYEKRAWTCP